MASRVNVRFVLILGAVLGLAFAGVVAVAYFALAKTAHQSMELGDKAMAAGEYDKAVGLYGSAVAKDQTNVAYIQKWLGALEKTTPTPRQVYEEQYQLQYMLALRGFCEADRTSVPYRQRFLGEWYEWLTRAGAKMGNWQLLVDLSDEMIKGYRGPEGPGKALLKYRGLARLRQYEGNTEPKLEDLQQARADLEAAATADPRDEETAVALAMADSVLSSTGPNATDKAKADEMVKAATERLKEFVDRNKPAASARAALLRMKMADSLRASTSPLSMMELLQSARDDVRGLADAVLATSPEKLDRAIVQLAATWVSLSFAATDGAELSDRLFEHALKGRPNDASLLMGWGRHKLTLDEVEPAVEKFEMIAKSPDLPLSLDGRLLFALRPEAIRQQAEAMFQAWDRAADAIEKAKFVERARGYRRALAAIVGEQEPAVGAVDGRLAYIDGDLAGARILLNKYNEDTRQSDAGTVVLLGRLLERQGDLGAAIANYQRAVQLDPRNFRVLVALAVLQARTGDFTGAVKSYTSAAAMFPPGSDQARELESRAKLVRAMDLKQGGQGTGTDPVITALTEAMQLSTGVDADAAAAERVLSEAMAKTPDPKLAAPLARLMASRGDREGGLALVKDVRKKWPDDKELKQLEAALSIQDPIAANVKAIEDSNLTDVQKFLGKWELFSRVGQVDKAKEQLQAAARLAPEDPMVVSLLFQEALLADNSAEITRLAELARAKNLDRVDGLLYQARKQVKEAKGDQRGPKLAEAVATLKQVVDRDKLNQFAWRLLGGVHLAQGEPALAAEAYSKAVQLRPDDVPSITGYLRALVSTGRLDEALRLAHKSETFAGGTPEFVEMLLQLEAGTPQGDRKRAIELRRRLAERKPDDRNNKVSLAMLLIDERRWDEARTAIDDLSKSPDFATAQLDAAWYGQQGKAEQAVKALNDHLASIAPEKRTEDPYLVSSRLLRRLRLPGPALELLEAGREYQSKQTLSIDRERADLYFETGRYEEAVKAYTAVLEGGVADPDDRITKRMIEAMLFQKQYAKVDEMIAALGAKAQSDGTLLLLGAESAARQGDRTRARRLLDQAVTVAPKNAAAYLKRAEFNAADPALMKDVEADLEESARLAPQSTIPRRALAQLYLRSGRFDAAIQQLTQAIKNDPGDAQLRLDLISMLISNKRESEALELLDQALKSQPDSVDWLMQASRIYADIGKPDRGTEVLARAWALNKSPDIAMAYIGALLALKPPDVAKAGQILSTPELRTDQSMPLRMSRAQMLAIAGRGAEAAADVTASFAMVDPNDPSACQALFGLLSSVYPKPADRMKFLTQLESRGGFKSWAALQMAMQRITQPETQARGLADARALAEGSEDSLLKVNVWRLLGSVAYQSKRFEDAAEAFKKGIEAAPEDPELTNNLAYTLGKELNRPAEALPFAEKAATLSPNSANALDTHGAILLALKDCEKAVTVLVRAVALATSASEQAPATLHLAQSRLCTGDRAEATRLAGVVADILDQNPELKESYEAELKQLREAIDRK